MNTTSEADPVSPAKTLLRVDSSVRIEGSISRSLTEQYTRQWRELNPGGKVITRDLASPALPLIDQSAIEAFFTPIDSRTAQQSEAIALSDRLVDEILAADTLLIGAPMYNWSVTSPMKSWIDHVIRVGRTIAFGADGPWPTGLLKNKRAIVVIARGGHYLEGRGQDFDFQTAYLKQILNFMGVTDIQWVATEGLTLGDEFAGPALEESQRRIRGMI